MKLHIRALGSKAYCGRPVLGGGTNAIDTHVEKNNKGLTYAGCANCLKHKHDTLNMKRFRHLVQQGNMPIPPGGLYSAMAEYVMDDYFSYLDDLTEEDAYALGIRSGKK